VFSDCFAASPYSCNSSKRNINECQPHSCGATRFILITYNDKLSCILRSSHKRVWHRFTLHNFPKTVTNPEPGLTATSPMRKTESGKKAVNESRKQNRSCAPARWKLRHALSTADRYLSGSVQDASAGAATRSRAIQSKPVAKDAQHGLPRSGRFSVLSPKILLQTLTGYAVWWCGCHGNKQDQGKRSNSLLRDLFQASVQHKQRDLIEHLQKTFFVAKVVQILWQRNMRINFLRTVKFIFYESGNYFMG